MSRSKHTDPRAIRARRRLRNPFGRRDVADLSKRQRLRLTLLESDDSVATNKNNEWHRASRPRIIWQQPRPGFHHPLTEQDVVVLLETISSLSVYGLRSIEFVRVPASHELTSLVFGRYETPGRILLFEQAPAPWHFHAKLLTKDVDRFARHGAEVNTMQSGVTIVNWPINTLRRFMLEEVVLHELGHHVLQHHKGKRRARIARTKDHEAFASLFAARQQKMLTVRTFSS